MRSEYVGMRDLAGSVIERVYMHGEWAVVLLEGGKYTSFRASGCGDGCAPYVIDIPMTFTGLDKDRKAIIESGVGTQEDADACCDTEVKVLEVGEGWE